MASIEEKIRRVKSMDSGGVVELLKKERIFHMNANCTSEHDQRVHNWRMLKSFFNTKPVIAACFHDLS